LPTHSNPPDATSVPFERVLKRFLCVALMAGERVSWSRGSCFLPDLRADTSHEKGPEGHHRSPRVGFPYQLTGASVQRLATVDASIDRSALLARDPGKPRLDVTGRAPHLVPPGMTLDRLAVILASAKRSLGQNPLYAK